MNSTLIVILATSIGWWMGFFYAQFELRRKNALTKWWKCPVKGCGFSLKTNDEDTKQRLIKIHENYHGQH